MLRILITDDSRSSRMLIESMLRPHGLCDTAVNGAEAVEKFAASIEAGQMYDLLVMDILMPVKDGLTAAKEIKAILEDRGVADDQGPKIIILSSVSDLDHLMAAQFDVGAMYIGKPFKEQVLHEALVNLGLVKSPSGEGGA